MCPLPIEKNKPAILPQAGDRVDWRGNAWYSATFSSYYYQRQPKDFRKTLSKVCIPDWARDAQVYPLDCISNCISNLSGNIQGCSTELYRTDGFGTLYMFYRTYHSVQCSLPMCCCNFAIQMFILQNHIRKI